MKIEDMELSPALYHWFVRPKWFANKYINVHLNSNYFFEGKNILDFGCGTGTSCTNFDPNSYLGIDCDRKRINFAQRKYPEYDFRSINGSNLLISDGVIDYILIISVLHHIPDSEIHAYFEEFRRVLKPDGKIILIEPCIYDKVNFRSRLMCFLDRGKYIRREEEYLNLFKRHQFSAQAIKKYSQLFIYRKIIIEASQYH